MKRIWTLLCIVCLLAGMLTGCAKTQGDPVTITFTVIGPDGTGEDYTLETTMTTLGDALFEAELTTASEHSGDGLYTTFAGIEANWDEDEAWWLISKDGEALTEGIDDIKLTDGDHYEATYTVGMS